MVSEHVPDIRIVSLTVPPFPYYLESGTMIYEPGEMHLNRTNIGVFDFLFVSQGSLHIGEDNRAWTLSAGHTLLLLPNAHHYPTGPCTERTVLHWLHFRTASDWRESDEAGGSEVISLPKHFIASDAGPILRDLARIEELAARPRSVARWEQQSVFLELLRRMEEGRKASAPSPSESIAEKTYDYIRRHYASELTNDSIARALHFHPNYVARCMKEVYRCTPMEYAFRYRMDQARLLLLTTEWSVARIADSVGYRYAPYFSNCFKQHFGESPLKFRKRYSGR